jgi:hypothetical protein
MTSETGHYGAGVRPQIGHPPTARAVHSRNPTLNLPFVPAGSDGPFSVFVRAVPDPDAVGEPAVS